MDLRLPRALARANRYVTNPVMGLWAKYLPPWAVIIHSGRRSGREYRTVLWAFRDEARLFIVLTYGETDWSRNVMAAGEAKLIRRGRTWQLTNPRIITADEMGRRPGLVGILVRAFGSALAADLTQEQE